MQESLLPSLSPSDFIALWRSPTGETVNRHRQADAQEFLLSLLTRLDAALAAARLPTFVRRLFEVAFCAETRCASGHASSYRQLGSYIGCIVAAHPTLQDALRALCDPEALPNFRCDVCGAYVQATRSWGLTALSNTVVIHLQRFRAVGIPQRMEKINDRLEFPVDGLDLRPYFFPEPDAPAVADAAACRLSSSLPSQDTGSTTPTPLDGAPGSSSSPPPAPARPSSPPATPLPPSQLHQHIPSPDFPTPPVTPPSPPPRAAAGRPYEYCLVGAVLHQGSIEGGHYRSLVRDRRSPTDWFIISDSSVVPYDIAQLETDFYGVSPSAAGSACALAAAASWSAYLLFYDRVAPLDEWDGLLAVAEDPTPSAHSSATVLPLPRCSPGPYPTFSLTRPFLSALQESALLTPDDWMTIHRPFITHAPSEELRVHRSCVGLENMGSTCYMNAVLQQLFAHHPFRYSLIHYASLLPHFTSSSSSHSLCSSSSPSFSTAASSLESSYSSSSIGPAVTEKEAQEFQHMINRTLELQRIRDVVHVTDYVNFDRTIQATGEMEEEDILNLVRSDLELGELSPPSTSTISHADVGLECPCTPIPPPPTKADALIAITTIERFMKSRPALVGSSNLVWNLRDLLTMFDGTKKRQQTLDDLWGRGKKA
jgi:ubiquitin C-terminal hydrolase